MSRTSSSQRWLDEHFSDRFVKASQKSGYRSRSAFKLLEIQQKDRLIKPGMTIIDLGAAPGGWSQVVVSLLKGNGKIIALDILPIDPIPSTQIIQGDCRDPKVMELLKQQIPSNGVDLVLSDMAPNMSGIADLDQALAMELAEITLDFSKQVLKPGGQLLIKIFQGSEYPNYLKQLRTLFKKVVVRKPEASRQRSREIYLLAQGFKGNG